MPDVPQRRRTVATTCAMSGACLALWAPIAVVFLLPFAVAGGAGGLLLTAIAGYIDRSSRSAPAAFLVAIGFCALALVIGWSAQ